MSESEPPADARRTNRSRISQADIPAISLEKACRVPLALADNYGSHSTRPLDVAKALDIKPSTGGFRTLCGAAVGYGLTEGGPNAPQISLSPLGKRIVRPTELDDDRAALREAALRPTVAKEFYTKYDGSALPPKHIAQNVLAGLSVPDDRTGDVYELLLENARYVGILKTIRDRDYVDIGSVAPGPALSTGRASKEDDLPLDDSPEDVDDQAGYTPPAAPPPPPGTSPKNAIFVGHGGNRKPMEQLIKILNEYGIPCKQAIGEANRARPIPQKVAETMRECGAAILVFTADVEYFDAAGNSVWRPSENVSHELGAASVLYGERIVVFKEKGIDLPSNFSSVGYIEFEKDKLSDKGIDLFRELVSMKILSFSVG